jgi:hypothetical protein
VAVDDAQAVTRTVAEHVRDHVAQPRGVDDHLSKAAGRETFEVIFDQTFATDTQQWFGLGVRERTHPFAATRGQDHGLHGRLTCERAARDA